MMRSAVHTSCPYCGVGCGLLVMPDGTVRGDKTHPANHGRLCSKGAALGLTLDDRERLTQPHIGGSPSSWDATLDLIATQFSETIAAHGPDSVAFYISGQCLTEDYYVANKLMKGFIGSANIDTNSRLCMASSVAGHVRAFGEDVVPGVYEDWDEADLVILVGSNTAWCHPILYQRLIAARAQRRTRVVVLDPRRTATAEEADLYLPLRPGSDVLLFNGLLFYLAATGALNHGWIARHTTGFADALAVAQAEAADLAAVSAGCDLDPLALETFYRWFAATERVLTVFSQGVNQSASGTDKVNAIINCHLATGRIGRPGSGPFSLTGQPNAMGGREVGGLANQLAAHRHFNQPAHRDALQRFWRAPHLAERHGLKAVELFDAVLDGRVRALWITATNPAVSLPRAGRVRAALAACPFIVVADCWPTDTTRYAHVVLPAAGWGEKDGTVTNSERRISRQRKFRSPPGEARPDWWMFTELARRMGFGHAFSWDSPAAIFREHAALSGFENDGERAFDISALTALDDLAYDRMKPSRWPLPAGETEEGNRLFANGGFSTPDRRARFIPTPYRSLAPTHARPFLLNTGRVRDQWHTMTRTGRVARLMTHAPQPTVAVNPADAARLDLSNGDLARIETNAGSVLLPVSVHASQRPGELFIPMHWTDAFSSAGPIDRAVSACLDPHSGQPALKATPASISRIDVQFHGILLRSDGGALPPLCHWMRTPLETGQFYRLHGTQSLPTGVALDRFIAALLAPLPEDGEWLEMEDRARGVFRRALVVDGTLRACVLLAREPASLSRHEAIVPLLGTPIPESARWRALFGGGQPETVHSEQPVCACFGVGRASILAAIREHGLQTTREIGVRVNAGTNCGSCLPELSAILREFTAESATLTADRNTS